VKDVLEVAAMPIGLMIVGSVAQWISNEGFGVNIDEYEVAEILNEKKIDNNESLRLLNYIFQLPIIKEDIIGHDESYPLFTVDDSELDDLEYYGLF